ncbi:signal recognition particle-docking protein FtsY [Peptoniphilus obesi]|uniref:signal recognition particle-docking protein FtsY n=1 Tax=Peptoniphilus obesi TaxID=1472765 RepID=UPI0004BB64F0|nr:signal recognition particle-docking protein FtsY [Peptoniphilus obesi]
MFKWIKNVFKNEDEEILEENKEKDQEKLSEAEDKEENLTKEDLEVSKEEIDTKEKQEKIEEETDKEINQTDQIEEKSDEAKDEAFQEIKAEDKEEDLSEESDKETEEVESVENIEKIEEKQIEETKDEIEIKEEKIEQVEEIKVDEDNQEEKPVSFFKRLKSGLTKTRNEMGVKINTILGQYVKIDDELLEDLEDTLISADVGMDTTMKLIDNLRETIIQNKINDPNQVLPLLKEEVKKLMDPDLDTSLSQESPLIILVIGVNGVGKTTTIGKLSSRLKANGKKVLIAAADTFRAAAIDQLKTWGTRSGVDVIAHSEGADPAAVIFDAIAAAKSRNTDVLICDTAGRLHNKANLMKELEKINKVISREYPEAARETILVLDATTGQNAISQAKTFKETCDPTGIALTKLDGTAKGGVVIALQSELKLPIKLVGVGEQIEDLQDFNMNNFINAIFD